MAKTSIEWADHSINPIRARNLETGAVGHFCEKVSPGCANCYSSAWNRRVRPSGTHLIGTGLEFLPANREKVATFLDQSKLQEVLRRQKPTRYFWCDMTDLFGEWVLDAEIDACFAVMALTPQHTHLVLTKRAERMRAYFATSRDEDGRQLRQRLGLESLGRVMDWYEGGKKGQKPDTRNAHIIAEGGREGFLATWPIPNVWLGVSVENQRFADERIPLLLQTPAAVRFISAEPLLGPVDLARWMCQSCCGNTSPGDYENGEPPQCCGDPLDPLDWVIVGGESGAGARPCDLAWVRSIVQQCKAAGVPVFCKQMGSLPVADGASFWLRNRKGGNPSEWPAGDWPREFPNGA